MAADLGPARRQRFDQLDQVLRRDRVPPVEAPLIADRPVAQRHSEFGGKLFGRGPELRIGFVGVLVRVEVRGVAPDQLPEAVELAAELLPRLEVEAEGEIRVARKRFRHGGGGLTERHQAGAGDDPLLMRGEDPFVDGGRQPEVVGVDNQEALLAHDLRLPEKNVYRTGDSAFWNSHVEDNPELIDAVYESLGVAREAPVFGMTVVKWSFPKSKDPAAMLDRYTDAVARAADHMAETYGLTPVIFNQVSEDLPASLDVQRKARCRIIVDQTSREPDILRATIARSKVFLGTRFHSCIFSMMAGRPTFAIAYLPKTEYIMNDLKLSHRHTPIDAVDYDYLIKTISADYENLDQAEAEIRNAVKVYQRDFTRLQDVLGLIGRSK